MYAFQFSTKRRVRGNSFPPLRRKENEKKALTSGHGSWKRKREVIAKMGNVHTAKRYTSAHSVYSAEGCGHRRLLRVSLVWSALGGERPNRREERGTRSSGSVARLGGLSLNWAAYCRMAVCGLNRVKRAFGSCFATDLWRLVLSSRRILSIFGMEAISLIWQPCSLGSIS